MNTKLSSMNLSALLLLTGLGAIFAVPSVAAADNCNDTSNFNGDMGCDIDCLAGESVAVAANGNDDDYWGFATCQGSTASCPTVNIGIAAVKGSYGCSDRATNYASRAGDGDCSGNSGGGTGGRVVCLSGSGEGSILQLLNVASMGASCQEIEPMLIADGVSSFVYKETDGVGGEITLLKWNSRIGCAPLGAETASLTLTDVIDAVVEAFDEPQLPQLPAGIDAFISRLL